MTTGNGKEGSENLAQGDPTEKPNDPSNQEGNSENTKQDNHASEIPIQSSHDFLLPWKFMPKWPLNRAERIEELEKFAPFYKGTPQQENIAAAIAWHATFPPNETAPKESTFFQNGQKVEESQLRLEDGLPWEEVSKEPVVYYSFWGIVVNRCDQGLFGRSDDWAWINAVCRPFGQWGGGELCKLILKEDPALNNITTIFLSKLLCLNRKLATFAAFHRWPETWMLRIKFKLYQARPVGLTPLMLPNETDVDVKDSSFFCSFSTLPTPGEVRAQAQVQCLAGTAPDKRKQLPAPGLNFVSTPPVVFESKGVFVKWGHDIKVSEAQCLYALNRFLKGAVPVPELYGWRTENDCVYIYMQALHGRALELVWDTLDHDSRNAVCEQLYTIFNNLRQLKQSPDDRFIGSISRSKFFDRVIGVAYWSETGPFTSVKDFHDWFSFLCRRPMADPHSIDLSSIREQLPDDAEIKFTHGDLHRSNIIVDTACQPPRVVAIVDWEQSGWYPEYWEERKAFFTTLPSDDWAKMYLPNILKSYKSTEWAWGFYADSMI